MYAKGLFFMTDVNRTGEQISSSLTQWATWREIQSQPDVWREWLSNFDVDALRDWVRDQHGEEVWFCGAGSSAYLGDILASGLSHQFTFRSIPSTDLVSAPQRYVTDTKALIVNFGRSGNSAESIGTMDVLDALMPELPRMNITCNANGALATRRAKGANQVVLMPDMAHDTGFAMTCSFSTMLLAALAIFDKPIDIQERVKTMADQLQQLLPVYSAAFASSSGSLPQRSVFLGAGELAFVARESALKVLELTAGNIPSLWDSTLGFRHGPKSFVTKDTIIAIYLTPDSPANQYDDDLVSELRRQFRETRVLTIGPGGDINVDMPYGSLWAAPVCVAAAQIGAVIWANALGGNVDDPFVGLDTLTRVVADVKLYPVAQA